MSIDRNIIVDVEDERPRASQPARCVDGPANTGRSSRRKRMQKHSIPLVGLQDDGNVQLETESALSEHPGPSSSEQQECSHFPSPDVSSVTVPSQYHLTADEDSSSVENTLYSTDESPMPRSRPAHEWNQAVSTSELTSGRMTDLVLQDRKYKGTISTASVLQEDNSGLVINTNTPVKFAYMVQSWMHAMYSISHGLLGGLALAHVVLVCSVAGPNQDIAAFASVYSVVAMPFQAMFFFLAALCMMSTLDKCSFTSLYDIWAKVRMAPTLILLLVVYGTTFFLTSLTTYWDLQLITVANNNTLSEHVLDITSWKILSLLRCLGGVLGYVQISLLPSSDLILARLNSMRDFQNMNYISFS